MDDPGKGENRYRSFVLRCWQEGCADTGEPCWRFSLEESGRPGGRKGFDRVELFAAYLAARLNESEATGGA